MSVQVQVERCYSCKRLMDPREPHFPRRMPVQEQVGRDGVTVIYEIVTVCGACNAHAAQWEQHQASKARWERRWGTIWRCGTMATFVLYMCVPFVYHAYVIAAASAAVVARGYWKWTHRASLPTVQR